jgi:hypothetical protein
MARSLSGYCHAPGKLLPDFSVGNCQQQQICRLCSRAALSCQRNGRWTILCRKREHLTIGSSDHRAMSLVGQGSTSSLDLQFVFASFLTIYGIAVYYGDVQFYRDAPLHEACRRLLERRRVRRTAGGADARSRGWAGDSRFWRDPQTSMGGARARKAGWVSGDLLCTPRQRRDLDANHVPEECRGKHFCVRPSADQEGSR